jgi:Aspartyl protease
MNNSYVVNNPALPWQIPLQFIREGIPLVVLPAFVNDAGPFQFILDTGNATTPFILSRQLAEKLKINSRPSSMASSATT